MTKKKDPKDLLKRGAPTKYKPEYCERLIKHMAAGFSFESFGAIVDVNRDTLYEWEKVHLIFSDAKKRGSVKSLYWWEKEGKAGLWSERGENGSGMTFNTTNWIFQMKNRHRWCDRRDVSMDAKVTDVNELEREKIKKLSMNELKKLVINNIEEKNED